MSSQLLRSWAGAWTRPILRTPQRTQSWKARTLGQSSRPGSGSDVRFEGMLQDEPALPKVTKRMHAARTTMSKGAAKATQVLSQQAYGQQIASGGKKAIPEPSPVNSPSWSRFDIARNPNRTPLPKHQEPPRAHEKARGSTDRPSGAVRGPGARPLPEDDQFRGKAGLAPPCNGQGTEERMPSPFSSGIPARAPFRPLNSQTDKLPRETQDDLTSVHSGTSRFTPTPKPKANIVKPDALRYEPTDYKDPVTSKYLVAKERFRPSVEKDWSTPQKLSRENWLPRKTLNPRLVKGSEEDAQKDPSISAGNAMYKLNIPGPDAVTGSPAQREAETGRDQLFNGGTPEKQVKAVNLQPGEETTPTPPEKTPARARQDAMRRLELIERHRKYLCGRHGVDPDASRHGHEGAIQAALERFTQRYDFKAERRERRKTKQRTKRRKVSPKVARKVAEHRQAAKEQAQRLAGAILGPVSRSA